MYSNKSYFIVLLLILAGFSVSGQFNMKIGYLVGYSPFSGTNMISDQYNSERNLEQILGAVHVMHGAHVGARFKLTEGLGFEINWENLGTNKQSVGFDANEDVFTDKFFFSQRSLGIGMETYIGRFGYGTTIERTRYRIRTDIDGVDTKRGIVADNAYSSKFYLLFNIQEGSSVSLVFKPFFHLPWSSFDISGFNTEVSGVESLNTFNERPWFVGFGILFYNGKQERR